jgi:exosortase
MTTPDNAADDPPVIKGRGAKKTAALTGPASASPSNNPAADPADKPLKGTEPTITLNSSELPARVVMALLVVGMGIWAYWPTLKAMVNTWEKQPDYSHGYLVFPMALVFLWFRKESYPGFASPAWIVGWGLIFVALAVRMLAALTFMEAFDGWSLLPWLAGTVALLFGLPMLRWSWSSIAFLFFMVPLPYGAETAMSHPLQRIATTISCWTLQTLGQPAISEGNTIFLGEHQLEVEQACSGLRLFVSILALAFGYIILMRKTWWENLLLLVSVIPIAIIANAARIVVTGLLHQFATSAAAKHFSHDLAGWAMVPFAALLFAIVLWYLKMVFPEREQMHTAASIRHR